MIVHHLFKFYKKKKLLEKSKRKENERERKITHLKGLRKNQLMRSGLAPNMAPISSE